MRIHFLLLFFALATVSPAPAQQQQQQPPAKVVTAQITREIVTKNRSFIGVLDFDKTSNISADVAGLAKQVLVREGSRVRQGDLLVELDTELLDREIAVQQNRLEQAGLNIEQAGKNLDRLEALLSRMGTSEKNYDDSVFAHQNALLEKKSAELELEKLMIRKRKSGITAPFDGIVLENKVETGEWVQQGVPLLALGSLEKIVIRVPAEESILRYVKPGDAAPVKINALDMELTGTVSMISPIADPRTKNIFVEVAIPAFDTMVVNMSAEVYLPAGEKTELSILPRDALIKFQGKDFVYTVKEGKAAILPVNIITFLGDRVGADDPHLTPGMPVVIEGNERLRPDQPVVMDGEN